MVLVYAVIIFLAVVFSYTQVDLNLTLSSWAPYQSIQTQLTQLGYFNRPLNALVWSGIFIAFIAAYCYTIKLAAHGKISSDKIKKIAILISIATLAAYTIFSHDLFNYMFDARIMTKYNENPYLHKALDYPQDDWIRFMHWTHRNYPYGPSWLGITAIPSWIGMQKLIPTMFLFKVMFSLSYIFIVVYSHRLLKLISHDEKKTATALALIALHPLLIIDGLISPHLDITMAAITVMALYFLQKNKKAKSAFAMFYSISIKYVTTAFVPILFAKKWLKDKPYFVALFTAALITTAAQIWNRGTAQPWYFILPLCIVPFLVPFYKLRTILILAAIHILPLWIYLYYLHTGGWKGALWFI